MKKLSVITFAVTALLFVNVTAQAQNGGSRNMQKRTQANSGGQYNQGQSQGNGQYGNNNYNQQGSQYNNSRGNQNEQYGQRNEEYGRGNREEQYGRREDDRRPAFRIFANHRRYRDNDRREEYSREYNNHYYHHNNY